MKKLLLTGIALVGAALVFAQPRLVAHRGFYTTPGSDENTISSLINAQQLGVYGVEFDVWLASDGVPVLNHDGWHYGYKVPDTPSSTLTTLKLENGETMPTLAQYLEAAKKTKVELVLELKPHDTPEKETLAAETVVKMIDAYKLAKRVTYITFSRHAMEELIRLAPAKTPVLYLGNNISPEELQKLGATGGDYNYWVYQKNPSWLDYLKQAKMISNVWTVDKPTEMIWTIDNKVDFITTDRPDLFFKLTR